MFGLEKIRVMWHNLMLSLLVVALVSVFMAAARLFHISSMGSIPT